MKPKQAELFETINRDCAGCSFQQGRLVIEGRLTWGPWCCVRPYCNAGEPQLCADIDSCPAAHNNAFCTGCESLDFEKTK